MSQQEKPITAYPSVELQEQNQEGGPGLDAELKPAANFTQLEFWGDDGKPYLEEYEGRALLKDKAVLITGGDSGIGRSVAVLMAREGADVSIVYLPEEEKDAQWTKAQIEKAGRRANLMASNVREEDECKKVVDGHIKAFGKLNVLVNNSMFLELNPSPINPLMCLHRRNAGDLQRVSRHRLAIRGEDLPDKHPLHFRHDQVCSPTHEARRLHRKLQLRRCLHGQPSAR